jgi:hypothetical protein
VDEPFSETPYNVNHAAKHGDGKKAVLMVHVFLLDRW